MNPNMLRKLQKMQKDLVDAQNRLQSQSFTGTAGGSMVSVEVLGSREVQKVTLNCDLVEDDKEMIEDMIVVAVNDALKKIAKEEEDINGSIAGGLGGGIPGLF